MVFKGMVMFVARFKRLEKKLVLSHSLVSQKVRGDMSGADNVILTQQYTTILIWVCTNTLGLCFCDQQPSENKEKEIM